MSDTTYSQRTDGKSICHDCAYRNVNIPKPNCLINLNNGYPNSCIEFELKEKAYEKGFYDGCDFAKNEIKEANNIMRENRVKEE